MQATRIDFVGFAPEHLDGAVALSRQAGWPHRREDWALVLALSTGFVALVDDRVVGTTLVTRYGRDSATINMVVVDEAMRGKGIGRRLMEAAMQATGGRECRLIATESGLPLYEKLGFRATGEILQHQGVPTSISVVDGIDWVTPSDVALLARLDQAACGMDRGALIALLSEQGRIAVVRREGQPSGFAALRAFGRGEVVGPVVAASADDARRLISFMVAHLDGAFVRVDTPGASGLSPWLAELGLAHVGGGIAMRGGDATADASPYVSTFALASQALG